MADAFDNEIDEPTFSIGDYIKAVEDVEHNVELWTKRNFRCDCGNSKFGVFYCKLLANKDVENSENKYNHNFKGTFCTCDMPYPDPNVEQVEMMQCCVCEDWFHEEHIGLLSDYKLQIPRDEEDEPLHMDFIFQGCPPVCSFLVYYPQLISASDTSKEKAGLENPLISSVNHETKKYSLDSTPCITNSDTEVGVLIVKCKIQNLVVNTQPGNIKPLFLFRNWRETLCRCEKCSALYAQKGISFLPEKEDSVAEYEKMAKEMWTKNMQRQEGAEMEFINNLGHVEKMEILIGIADMKNEIISFVVSWEPSKVITPEDIQQVFENLAKKRKRSQ